MAQVANVQSMKCDSLQVITSSLIDENNNARVGANAETPGSGFFMKPSTVTGRLADITDFIVTSANEYGKFEWTAPEALAGTFQLGDISNVSFTGVANNNIIKFDQASSKWINSTTVTLTGATVNGTVSGTTLTDGTATLTGGDLTAMDSVTYTKPTYTQATSITTTVPVTSQVGIITTQSASTAAGDEDHFSVTGDGILATSIVHASILTYSGTFGTAGTPIITVYAVGAGTFNIAIANVGGAALNGTFTIGFIIN